MISIYIKLDDVMLADWDETPRYKSFWHKALSGRLSIRDGWSINILIFR